MCAHRLWPTFQALGRGLINNRTEIFQQGVRVYNVQNFNNPNLVGQGYHQQNALPGNDQHAWTQCVTQSTRETFNKVYSLHSTNASITKDNTDSENEYAHSILRSLPAYSTTTIAENAPAQASYQSTVFPARLDWRKRSAQEVAGAFIAVSRLWQNQLLNDSDLSSICSALHEKLDDLSDCELLEILKSLALWPHRAKKIDLWKSLDSVCTRRIKKWDMSKMFLFADHWYALKVGKITTYNETLTRILGKKVTSMGPPQLVQFMFYANLNRRLKPYIVMTELQSRLSEVLEFVSIEELGVISMGCFKTQTHLKDEKLISAIIAKTQDNIELVSSPSLCSILKVLRKSTPSTQWRELYKLMDVLESQLPRLSTMCLLQAALLGSNVVFCHAGALNMISDTFIKEIDFCRLKDLERIAFLLSQLNHIPPNNPDIFQIIAQNLRRNERRNEIYKYPKSFSSCVFYLVDKGYYHCDLISAALEPSLISRIGKSGNTYEMRESVELDWMLEIEGPAGYKGHRLDPRERTKLTSRFLGRIPYSSMKRPTYQEKLTLQVRDKVAAILGGKHFIKIIYILPHMQVPDLVFCTSSEGYPVELPLNYLDLAPEALKKPSHYEKEVHWNAIIVGGINSFIKGSNKLQGKVERKKRQIRKLGYHVSLVSYMGFNGSHHCKIDMLRSILLRESTLKPGALVDVPLTIGEG